MLSQKPDEASDARLQGFFVLVEKSKSISEEATRPRLHQRLRLTLEHETVPRSDGKDDIHLSIVRFEEVTAVSNKDGNADDSNASTLDRSMTSLEDSIRSTATALQEVCCQAQGRKKLEYMDSVKQNFKEETENRKDSPPTGEIHLPHQPRSHDRPCSRQGRAHIRTQEPPRLGCQKRHIPLHSREFVSG